MEREQFKSRLGFLLVSAGCAIGIGNVWKFPYLAGENGGGLFVLFYLIFLAVMAAPILTMELAIGRSTRKSSVGAYRKLEKPGQKWHVHGYVCIIGCMLLMSYYTSVAGWMVDYFVRFATGTMSAVQPSEVADVFRTMQSSPAETVGYMALVVVLGFLVCSFSLQKGLERLTKVMMLGLLVLILVLAGYALTGSGAVEGLTFYLLPNFSLARKLGLGSVITNAMNQAFFTISIGVGSMEIFGSYMSRSKTLMSESVWICLLDTFVALMSGLIIFPSCFSFGVRPDSGPSLIFMTLPQVFLSMKEGQAVGAVFFLFMVFASFSTVIAVFENILSFGMEEFGFSRRKSAAVNMCLMLILSLPCALGSNVLSGVHLFGKDILGMEDFLVSNILLPMGALVYLIFCTWKWGWGFDAYLEETNQGKGLRIGRWLRPYFRYVLPVLILVILVSGLAG